MVRITDQYFWNFVFTLFFVGLITMGTIILDTEARMAYGDLTIIDLLLLALATYRATRWFVYDTAGKFIREQFWDAEVTKGKVLLSKPTSGPRRTIAEFFSNVWYVSTWVTAFVVFVYLLTPYAQFPVLVLALAGLGTLIHAATGRL